ncbi:carboxylate/amino acid/amine transporter [compost metagenome]
MPVTRSDATPAIGPWLILVLPPLLWAGNFVVGRAIHTEVPPMTLAFLRHLIALLCLLPFAWNALRRDVRRYWPLRWQLVRTAAAGLAGFNLLVYAGLQSTTASNALLLNSMIPVLIVLFGGLLYGQRLTSKSALGMALSCAGVVIIISHGNADRLIALQFSRGDVIVFLGMVCFALYSIWLRKLPTDLSPVGLLCAQLAVAVLLLLPAFLWEYAMGYRIVWMPSSMLGILYVAIVASLLATFLYMAGVSSVGPARAGLFIHLIPVYGAVLSTVLLCEGIHGYHVVGLLVILGGLLLSNRKESRNVQAVREGYRAAEVGT